MLFRITATNFTFFVAWILLTVSGSALGAGAAYGFSLGLTWLINFSNLLLRIEFNQATVSVVTTITSYAVYGFVMSAIQMIRLQRYLEKVSLWVIACTLGLVVGAGIVSVASGILGDITSIMLAGLVLGVAQWAVLREQTAISFWWVIATIVGFLSNWLLFSLPAFESVLQSLVHILDPQVGFVIAMTIVSFVTGATFGCLLGLATGIVFLASRQTNAM